MTKKWADYDKVTFLQGCREPTKQMSSLVLIRGLLMGQFKRPFLGEVETVRLSVVT